MTTQLNPQRRSSLCTSATTAMLLMLKDTCLLLLGVLCMGSASIAEQEKPWRVVRGNDLQELLAEQNLGDGVHYAYQFQRVIGSPLRKFINPPKKVGRINF
ncbi:MAG: hypothetical protein IPK02_20540 [Candidatus Accumulibacter sp.]|uniref:Uncharacterized protein n=1 Tax=Candidatus Accumulibacter affinis TaxID=2954384 RepID=A0A935TH19_9PROT|nr:hypothetical protein [Candidatus Accumulibacter affinis]